MPKFRKVIVRAGTYNTVGADGKNVTHSIDRNRLNHWVNNFTAMKSLGMNVPSPAYHDPLSVPTKEQLRDAKNNFGFWESLAVEKVPSRDGKGLVDGLVGVIDVPNEQDAERISKTVRETSILAKPMWIDADQRAWNDVITHIACCVNPVEPGQENFKPVGGEVVLSMSNEVGTPNGSESSPSPAELNPIENNGMTDTVSLVQLLKKVAGIALPQNIDPNQLVSALIAALIQKQLSERKDESTGSLTQPPANSQVNGAVLLMSNNQQPQVPAVTTPAAAPAQVVPGVQSPVELVMSHPAYQAMAAQNTGLLKMTAENVKRGLRDRLAGLRRRNIVNDAFVTEQEKEINALEMSFDATGTPIVPVVERVIAGLEQVRIPMPAGAEPIVAMANGDTNGNYVIQPHPTPESGNGEITQDRANTILSQMFGTTTGQ